MKREVKLSSCQIFCVFIFILFSEQLCHLHNAIPKCFSLYMYGVDVRENRIQRQGKNKYGLSVTKFFYLPIK